MPSVPFPYVCSTNAKIFHYRIVWIVLQLLFLMLNTRRNDAQPMGDRPWLSTGSGRSGRSSGNRVIIIHNAGGCATVKFLVSITFCLFPPA